MKNKNKIYEEITWAIACTEDLLAALCILQDEECNNGELSKPLNEIIEMTSNYREFLEDYYHTETNDDKN